MIFQVAVLPVQKMKMKRRKMRKLSQKKMTLMKKPCKALTGKIAQICAEILEIMYTQGSNHRYHA